MFRISSAVGRRLQLGRAQPRLPVRQFARLGAALFDGGAQPFDPDADLPRRPADDATGPDQFERRKLAPGLIAVDDGARDEIAAHRRGIETVPAKTAGQPDARPDFADL